MFRFRARLHRHRRRTLRVRFSVISEVERVCNFFINPTIRAEYEPIKFDFSLFFLIFKLVELDVSFEKQVLVRHLRLTVISYMYFFNAVSYLYIFVRISFATYVQDIQRYAVVNAKFNGIRPRILSRTSPRTLFILRVLV